MIHLNGERVVLVFTDHIDYEITDAHSYSIDPVAVRVVRNDGCLEIYPIHTIRKVYIAPTPTPDVVTPSPDDDDEIPF